MGLNDIARDAVPGVRCSEQVFSRLFWGLGVLKGAAATDVEVRQKRDSDHTPKLGKIVPAAASSFFSSYYELLLRTGSKKSANDPSHPYADPTRLAATLIFQPFQQQYQEIEISGNHGLNCEFKGTQRASIVTMRELGKFFITHITKHQKAGYLYLQTASKLAIYRKVVAPLIGECAPKFGWLAPPLQTFLDPSLGRLMILPLFL